MPRIGIDLGGTKIEGIVLGDTGGVVARERVATPSGDYPGTLQAIATLIARLEGIAGTPCRVGVATPGALSPATGRLRNANSTCLNGSSLHHDLSHHLAREVRIANDADCFALSEATDGSGKGARSVFGVIVGTGTGGGIVIDGKLLCGVNAIAGEWGHNPLPWPRDDERPGPACYCGKRGCIETFLSGPGLAADSGISPAVSAREIVERAAAGDPASEHCLLRYEDRMARALAGVINLLDPEIIVLGGGLSNVQRLYRNVPERWTEYVFSDVVRTRLLPPTHGDSSGVRGAAWLWPT
ncbi:MAG: ROK family protein [Gammaproteobacteria bacterium]|nr:ROK family protein [Gammaproteobacteria bacterium]